MTPPDRQYHRPTLFEGAKLDNREGGADPARLNDAAHTTAAALVDRGRASEDPELVARLVRLADGEGLQDLAALWSRCPAVTLPGALWRLYAIRRAVVGSPQQWSAGYRDGTAHAPVAEVVAGVAEPPGPDELVSMTDSILTGAFAGDFDVALLRAAAFCRVVAVGRSVHADAADLADEARGTALTTSARRLLHTAEDLEAAAAAWREGTLA